MSLMRQNDLIGSREAAERLGMPSSTFHRRVQDGTIPFVVKLPGLTAAYLFDPSVIEKIDREPTGELHVDNPDRYRSEGAA